MCLLYFDEFKAKDLGKCYSKHFCSLCAAIHEDVFLYVDMTEEGDILKVNTDDSCKQHLYLLQKLQLLERIAEIGELQWNINFAFCPEFEHLQGKDLLRRQKDLTATAEAISAERVTGDSLWGDFTAEVLRKSSHILDHNAQLNPPTMHQFWAII